LSIPVSAFELGFMKRNVSFQNCKKIGNFPWYVNRR
jgi:hypothetical protein